MRPLVVTPIERDRLRALYAAIRHEITSDEPGLPERVRQRQEAILASQARRRWIQIDPEILNRAVDRLDGLASTARHLGVAQTTIQRWRSRSRIPGGPSSGSRS